MSVKCERGKRERERVRETKRERGVCRVCEGNTDYGRTRTNRSNEGTVRNSLTMQLVPHLRTRVRKCVCVYVCVYVCLKESVRVCACDHMNEAGLRGRCPAWHSSQVKTDATFKRVTTTSRYPVTTFNRTVSLCISLTLFSSS